MSTFGVDSDAAARRRARREEARRRVDSGEVSRPVEAPTAVQQPSPKASRTKSKTTVASVDPAAVPGGKYAVWRSAQHFCVADSRPDAESEDLSTLLRWSDSIMHFRLRPRLVARLDSNQVWQPVCYVKDATRHAITAVQAEKFRDYRRGVASWTGTASKPLRESDHPDDTEQL